jgi:lipid A disaccharide synthetase
MKEKLQMTLRKVFQKRKELLEQIRKCNIKIKKLQQICPHVWIYNPDHFSNNDSSYICGVCRLQK